MSVENISSSVTKDWHFFIKHKKALPHLLFGIHQSKKVELALTCGLIAINIGMSSLVALTKAMGY